MKDDDVFNVGKVDIFMIGRSGLSSSLKIQFYFHLVDLKIQFYF